MPRKISSDCISCGTCVEACPVSAIVEGDEHYVISADLCVDCGACESECPMSAISEE